MEKTSDGYPPPLPVTADEAAFRLPPPSYEEIMGVYQTSVKAEQQMADIPPLAYIDIMPRCLKAGNIAGKVTPTFDDFSTTIEGANRWLQDNPGYSVWKCESVNRKLNAAKDGTISYELNEMLRHDATFGFNVYIKGIRLWLAKNSGPVQQLGVRTVIPQKVVIEVESSRYRRGRIIVDGEVVRHLNTYRYTTFAGLEKTMASLQKTLSDDPIPGSMLMIETDNVKAYEGLKRDFDPESTCWSENKDTSQRNTQVIRIYYIKGTLAREEIGYTQMVPEVIEQPESATKRGKFEPFDNVVVSLGRWVCENQGLRVVNIQQYDAGVTESLIFEKKITVTPDSTDDTISSYSQRRMARTLRVFYTKPKSSVTSPSAVTSRLFLPARTGRRSFETMTQTMKRVEAWLRLTGVPIFTVETVELLFNENNPSGADCTSSEYTVYTMTGKHWLTGIRVYFCAPYNEPDPALLPPLPVYKHGSSSCNIL